MQDLVSRVLELSREFQEKKVNLKTVKLTQSSKYNAKVDSFHPGFLESGEEADL